MQTDTLALYESGVKEAREAFGKGRFGRLILEGTDPDRLFAFLLHFCALGYQMTRPVEDWISRAGQRCRERGWHELGAALERHAHHEAGHERMMAEDTRTLARLWQERTGDEAVDPEVLLALPPSQGVERYVRLHEGIIAGEWPCAQLAIELEIERLSVSHGPALLKRCHEVLGAEALSSLSFLGHHVELDLGHTRFNERQLQAFLALHPGALRPMQMAGRAALAAYGAFLGDCVDQGLDWLSFRAAAMPAAVS